jgi:hypothetical protein
MSYICGSCKKQEGLLEILRQEKAALEAKLKESQTSHMEIVNAWTEQAKKLEQAESQARAQALRMRSESVRVWGWG